MNVLKTNLERTISWQFHNPVRIFFGNGILQRLPEVVTGRQVLLLTSAGFTRRGVTKKLNEMLEGRLVEVMDDVPANPDLDDLEQRTQSLSRTDVQVIVAVGGGSVIDTAKVLSVVLALREQEFNLRAYLESGASGLSGKGVPVVAVPTTAGTGSEVTPFATVWDRGSVKKYSLSGPMLFPDTAIVDPLMTMSLPFETTIVTGLDAISQAFEAIWNRNAIPVTTLYATESLRNSLFYIDQLASNLSDARLRARLAYASLLAGLAISHTRTAIAHSISYPLTLHFSVPHGLACGFSLPAVLKFNLEVDDGRLQRLSESLGFRDVLALGDHLAKLLERLGVWDMLRRYVSGRNAMSSLVGEMYTPDRASNNLRFTDSRAIEAIIHEAEKTLFAP